MKYSMIVLSALCLFIAGCGFPKSGDESKDSRVENIITKTYANPSGYSVDYPSDWSIETSLQNENTHVSLRKNIEVTDAFPSPCLPNFAAVSITGPWNYKEKYQTFDEFVASNYESDPTNVSLGNVGGKKEELLIHGLSTYKFGVTGAETICSGPTYYIRMNNQMYLSVFVNFDSKNQQNVEGASKIVESIKLNQ